LAIAALLNLANLSSAILALKFNAFCLNLGRLRS